MIAAKTAGTVIECIATGVTAEHRQVSEPVRGAPRSYVSWFRCTFLNGPFEVVPVHRNHVQVIGPWHTVVYDAKGEPEVITRRAADYARARNIAWYADERWVER